MVKARVVLCSRCIATDWYNEQVHRILPGIDRLARCTWNLYHVGGQMPQARLKDMSTEIDLYFFETNSSMANSASLGVSSWAASRAVVTAAAVQER
jgi:hypothetical protein